MLKAFFIILAVMASAPAVFAADSSLERRAVAQVIAAEACGEGVKGMEYVAQAIRNRDRKGKDEFYAIVMAKNQFYGATAKNRVKLFKQCEKEALAVTEALYAGQLGQETNGATFFRQPKEKRQAWHKVETLRWKGHIFYK